MCAFTRRFVDDFEIKRLRVCERTLHVCVCSHECVFVSRQMCARAHCFSGYIFSNRKPWVFSDIYSHYLLVSSLCNGQFSYVFDSLLRWVLFFLMKSFLIVNISTKRRNFAKDLVTSINCIYASSLLEKNNQYFGHELVFQNNWYNWPRTPGNIWWNFHFIIFFSFPESLFD